MYQGNTRSFYMPGILFCEGFMIEADNSNIKGRARQDSLFIVLRRSKRHFQLAERQFHWLSEYNR